MTSLCLSRSGCLPCQQCHQKPHRLFRLVHVSQVTIPIDSNLVGTPEENTNKRSSTVSVLDSATPYQTDFLHVGDKWSIWSPLRKNVQNPGNVFREPPLSGRAALKFTGMEVRVPCLLPSIREDLTLRMEKWSTDQQPQQRLGTC